MRPGLALLFGCAFVQPLWAIDVKLPEKIAGNISDFIVVRAETQGATVKWVVLDVGLRLFPPELLKDTKAAVVTSATAGNYRLLAYTSDASGPSNPAVVIVTVGTPEPGPVPPSPGPLPPGPAPVPQDPFFRSLQAAYTADTNTDKAKQRDDLAELYIQADTLINNAGTKTASDLLTKLRAARGLLMPDSAFLAERQAIEKYLNSVLPTDPAALLDQPTKTTLLKEFHKVSQYLRALQ